LHGACQFFKKIKLFIFNNLALDVKSEAGAMPLNQAAVSLIFVHRSIQVKLAM
jgi:hypothetical protein